jgi:hypothetical protein
MDGVPLGQRKVLSLQEARAKASEGRVYAKAGLDPTVEWAKVTKATPTFEEAARQFHDNNKAGWKNVEHAAKWLTTLEAYAFPSIGKELPERIDGPMI